MIKGFYRVDAEVRVEAQKQKAKWNIISPQTSHFFRGRNSYRHYLWAKWNGIFIHFSTISDSLCLKITVKVLFNIVSEAKFIKNGEFGEF